ELLEEFGGRLDDNSRHSLVITLIKNCSSVNRDDFIPNPDKALEALEKFGDQLVDKVRHSLVRTLIENCSGIDRYSRIRNQYKALEVLEKFGDQLDDKVRHSLVITLIKNCSGINLNGRVRGISIAMKLLNQNKQWLREEEREFYERTAENLFTSADHSEDEILTQFLEINGEVVSADIILNKYNQTDSIRIVQAIRAYVQGAGQHRRINLPARLDLIANGQPVGGIAFEVHKFTEGIESGALKAIDEFLTALEVSKPEFTIDDLRDKFNLIEDEQLRTKANNALVRISGSVDYTIKLKAALPAIASFLNLDHTTWETDYQTQKARWSMWLTQSFVEAGLAYADGNDTTSCVKGVYERLFTGFRSMHPLIDCLFVTQTVTTEFNDGIDIWLKNAEHADKIVAGLKAKGLIGTEDEEVLKGELKQAYFQAIENELKYLIGEGLEACFNKLTDFNKLSCYLVEEINGRKSQIINDALKKVAAYIDNIEYIMINEEQSLDKYIKHQLKTPQPIAP
ncbi:MAG: hypothetical protein ACK4M7_07450, partial [Burkholderiales bacterium]